MCVFCAAIPTTAAAGMALDQKSSKKNANKKRPFYSRPYLMLAISIILVLMAASVIVHTQKPG
jgi:hypothetical protein